MERIEIPGHATYSPVSLSDLFVGAPLASRLLLGAVMPGNVISTVALGLYAGSAARDWIARFRVRPIDFQREYGADVHTLQEMPILDRLVEIRALGEALNRDYTADQPPREEVARRVNRRLTDYIASITDQEVITSDQVRGMTLTYVVFPFAIGSCDVISGDVAIYQDTGHFEPHIIAHEFCHRKGYFKELHAQALAYLASRTSDDPVLVQSARCERLHRQLRAVSGDNPDRFREILATAGLRPALQREMLKLTPAARPSTFSKTLRALYDQRMKISGQNGISDYDVGFTNLLWTFARSESARQPRAHAHI